MILKQEEEEEEDDDDDDDETSKKNERTKTTMFLNTESYNHIQKCPKTINFYSHIQL